VRPTKIVKVQLKKQGSVSNYTTSEAIFSLFSEFEKKQNLPVFDILKILIQGKVNSISFTKDVPYFYFYSRSDEQEVLIKFNDLQKEIEIPITMEILKNILNTPE